MTEQAALNEREHKLAFLLQTTLDFAFGRMSEGKRLIPFATRVASTGAVDVFRIAGEETEEPLGLLYGRVEQALAAQAAQGDLQAVALGASIQGDEMQLGKGFYQAIRVHLEMPGYVRVVFQPYRIDAGGAGEKSKLALGNVVAEAAEPAVFVSGSDTGGATIFSLT